MEPQRNTSPPFVQQFLGRFQATTRGVTATAAFALVAHAATSVETARGLAALDLTPVSWREGPAAAKVPIDGKGWPGRTPAEGLALAEQYPTANIGAVLRGRFVVVDIDGPDGLVLFLDHVGWGALPLGPRVKTGKGWHLYYQAADLTELRQQRVERGAGQVEFFVPTSPRWLAMPPSIHPEQSSRTSGNTRTCRSQTCRVTRSRGC